MTDAFWKQVREIFEIAKHLDADAQRMLLDRRCAGNEQLRGQVERLLEAHRAETDFLSRPALGKAFNIDDVPVSASDDSSSDDPMVGRFLGPYRLIARIGGGGMGSVYLAERSDEAYTKEVAVKLIKRGMDSEEIVRRFESERQILANLEHPNIARLIDGGMTDDGRPYIVMEHVRGQPIDEYCSANSLPMKRRIELFRRVCMAVHTAHQNLVVHRDLKPENILITCDGDVKLLDFGIAKVIDPGANEGAMTLTLPHRRRMTLRYASPEQVRGEAITTASDVYSLGVILFELLTGTAPYVHAEGDSRRMEGAICDEPPPRPSTAAGRPRTEKTTSPRARDRHAGAIRASDRRAAARRLRGDLDTIVLAALRKEPSRRYGSALQLAEDLRRYQLGLPVVAQPDTWLYRTRKFIRRHAVGVGATAAVMLTLAGLLALSMSLYVEASRAREAMTQERDRAIQSERLAEVRRREAETKAAIAEAVNRFINDDLLASADTDLGAGGGGVSVREVLDNAAGSIEHAFGDQPEVEAAVRLTIGRAYRSLGRFDEARTHIERAIELHESVHGREHPDALFAIAAYGTLLRDQGEYDQAARLLETAISGLTESIGEDDERTLESIARLADVRFQQGDLDTAKALYVRVLDRCRDKLGEQHPLTIMLMQGTAAMYDASGQHDRAEQLLDQAMEASLAMFGRDHRRTLSVKNALASLYHSMGRQEETERILEEVVLRQQRILGERHPSTLVAMSNLAASYTMRGRYELAEPLLERTIELRRDVLGDDHPHTLRTLNSLAVMYFNQRRFEEAQPLFATVYALRREILGPDHAHTLNTMSTLAILHRLTHQYDDAERLYLELIDLQREKFGEQDISALASMHQLGRVYRAMERFEESLELTSLINRAAEDLLPETDWRIGAYLIGQAQSLVGLERHEEALPLLERAHGVYRDVLGRDHALTRTLIADLAQTHRTLGQYEKAEQRYLALIDIQRDAHGERAEATLRTMHALAEVYCDMGRFEESYDLMTFVNDAADEVLSADDWRRGLYLAIEAESLRGLHRLEEALSRFKAAHEILAEALGETHERTHEIIASLVQVLEQLGDADGAIEWQAMLRRP